MLSDVKKANPKQHGLIVDRAPYSAGLCPRRAGKTYACVMTALITGESKPGSIAIIISLNKQQLRRVYWEGGASGIYALARKYKLNLEYHNGLLRWTHENGSLGYLMGADDDEQLELLRGMEADVYVIDECKSFAVGRLRTLINEILTPQRASRQGRIILIGTPGYVEQGPFFEATCDRAIVSAGPNAGRPFSVAYGEKDPWGRTPHKDRLWSRHHWTLEDNSPMRHQWEEALLTKAANNLADDDAWWLHEFLGLWSGSTEGLVYRYASAKSTGRVTWAPEFTEENPTGLPEAGGPWRLVAGLDIGFEDSTALVVAGYSTRLRQLRVFHDTSQDHMLPDDVADLLAETVERFGSIEKIFVDNAGLGKMVVEGLARRGFPVEAADKREKFDHIELLNSAFTRGEVQVVENTVLEHQLLTNAWDLKAGTREQLAKAGRLKEDKTIPNDSTDALLYLFRGSLHAFGHLETPKEPEVGTEEYYVALNKRHLAAARQEFRRAIDVKLGASHTLPRAPWGVQRALQDSSRWQPPTLNDGFKK